jgi:hypothetical protein
MKTFRAGKGQKLNGYAKIIRVQKFGGNTCKVRISFNGRTKYANKNL